jgi:L-asparagine transporter-like permease
MTTDTLRSFQLWLRPNLKWLILAAVAIAAITLLAFAPQALTTLLPFAPVALCLLMHVWMMRNHGGHGAQGEEHKAMNHVEPPDRT